MKLLINIPEKDYNNIEPFLNGQTINGGFNLFQVLEIIKNGIKLDDAKESEAEFHCGVDESGGHAYNCNDCPNKCEEWYQWGKEENK